MRLTCVFNHNISIHHVSCFGDCSHSEGTSPEFTEQNQISWIHVPNIVKALAANMN